MFKPSVLSSAITAAIAISTQPAFAQQDEEAASDGVPVIEEVVVTGVRASITKAIEIKRENVQILDSIVAEDIGKFPDNNVVEALQRVSGIQVTDRASGEVNLVTIRGLSDVSTTVNGRHIFTGTGRDVALADIPASLLNRVDVYKTRAASRSASGIAGQIDIHTNRPFDFDGSKLVVAARGIYQDLAEEIDPSVSMLASNVWDTNAGEFGALINVSYAKTHYRDQSVTAGAAFPYDPDTMERIPERNESTGEVYWTPGLDSGLPYQQGSTLDVDGQSVEYLLQRDAIFASDFEGTRERPAANISLQWAPNENSEYMFEAFYNGYRNESFNSLLFIFSDGNNEFRDPVLYEGTNVVKEKYVNNPNGFGSGDQSTGKTDSFVYALGGDWSVGENLELKSEVVYQESTFESEFFAMRTTRSFGPLSVDYNYNGTGVPAFGILDDPATMADESDLTNPADWNMADLYDNGSKNDGSAITWTGDAEYFLDWNGITSVEFGLSYDKREAQNYTRGQTEPNCGACELTDYPGLGFVNDPGFFDGRAYVPDNWLVADGYFINDNADVFRNLYGLEPGGSPWEESTRFDIDEETAEGYVQASYEYDVGNQRIDGQLGFRVIATETNMSFVGQDVRQSDGVVVPSFALRYHITDDIQARLNYGETYRKPAFGELNPLITLTPSVTGTLNTATSGNPYLLPTTSKNFDLGLEWYFGDDSSIYGVLFKRDIEGFVYATGQSLTVSGNADPDLDGEYVWTRPANSSDGTLEGAELGFVYFPDNLPSLLDGFGLQGSATLLDSEQDFPINDSTGAIVDYGTKPIFNVSDSSYSLILAYDNYNFDARLSYTWRDDFLYDYDDPLFAQPRGRYRKPEQSMDFQISYDITDEFVVTFDATNLTNELFQVYYQEPDIFNYGSAIYSRTYALGIRYSM